MTPAARRLGLPPLAALLSLTPLFAPPALSAQRADFLFSRPHATLGFTTGVAQPGEGSDLFAEAREHLTVKRGAFASPFIMADLGIRLTERLDLAFGLEHAGSAVHSEMRDWVTQDDQPITQTTEFKRSRLTAGLRAYLLRRGRSISDYAWVPNRFSPYLAGGLGVTWYEFVQYGDFVDYETWDIFGATIASDGAGWTPYAAAGLDVTLHPYILLRSEVRHYWGTGSIDRTAFDGFNDIDLSGLRGAVGLVFRMGGRI